MTPTSTSPPSASPAAASASPATPPEGVQAFIVLDWEEDRLVAIEILDASSRLRTSATASPVAGQPITTQVTVTGQFTGSGVPAPAGAVTVSDGTRSCQATLSGSAGVASGSCQLTESAAGTYSFRASYPGDSNFTASQTPAPTTVTVGHATSATSITPATATAVAGQPVTETVKVSGEFTGSGDPHRPGR